MYLRFLWTPEIEEHLAEHGVTVDDYEYAFANAYREVTSQRSGLPLSMDQQWTGDFYSESCDNWMTWMQWQ